MTTRILLLRGINVGGRNLLPMADLRALLAGLGATDVRTSIQSGNAVFRHADPDAAGLADRLAEAVERDHGFAPKTLTLAADTLERAIAANPFPEAVAEPKSLHLFFLAASPEPAGLARLRELAAAGERVAVVDAVLYLHAPAGIGRSKLAAAVEQRLGVSATARNWRTVLKLQEMVADAAMA